jgi:hypothetical protein
MNISKVGSNWNADFSFLYISVTCLDGCILNWNSWFEIKIVSLCACLSEHPLYFLKSNMCCVYFQPTPLQGGEFQ